jgi:hypothetical protein
VEAMRIQVHIHNHWHPRTLTYLVVQEMAFLDAVCNYSSGFVTFVVKCGQAQCVIKTL